MFASDSPQAAEKEKRVRLGEAWLEDGCEVVVKIKRHGEVSRFVPGVPAILSQRHNSVKEGALAALETSQSIR